MIGTEALRLFRARIEVVQGMRKAIGAYDLHFLRRLIRGQCTTKQVMESADKSGRDDICNIAQPRKSDLVMRSHTGSSSNFLPPQAHTSVGTC